MTTYQLQPITDETLARLPESKYHRMGGWLVVFVLRLLWTFLWSFSYVIVTIGWYHWGFPLSLGIVFPIVSSPHYEYTLVVYGGGALVSGITILLLLRRKLLFRIPFTILVAFAGFGTIYNAVRGQSYLTTAAVIGSILQIALWLIYIYTSDRVRVYCGMRPKRPVPMPVSQESEGT